MHRHTISPELPNDHQAIEKLLDRAFGLSRLTKTSYRLRERNQPAKGLSQVVRDPDLGIVGAISYWPVKIGPAGTNALLLGPLAVHPERQNKGIGLSLMEATLDKAKIAGNNLVILVGDLPYYARVGFRRVPEGQLVLPGFVNPERLLFRELKPHAMLEAQGLVLPPIRHLELYGAQREKR